MQKNMRYELQHRVPSAKVFGRRADPARPYIWQRVASSNDKQLLEDMKYKIIDGSKAAEKNYRIIDKEEEQRGKRKDRNNNQSPRPAEQ